MFSTPYSYANCHLSIGTSNLVQVSESGVSIFDTEMSVAKRLATRAGDETWEGQVFLPRRSVERSSRYFFGRLAGHTTAYPFLENDKLSLEPSPATGVLQMIVDSTFTPQEWLMRPDATHAKSRTYREPVGV